VGEGLRAGIAAAKAGDRHGAKELLLRSVEQEPAEPAAWIWLASVAEDAHERLRYVRRFLDLAPAHPKGLETLRKTLLELGIELARKGEKAEARTLISELVGLDPKNERAWLWLSSVAASAGEAAAALRRVLELHPRHQQALALLQRLEPAVAERPQPFWHCPLCLHPAPEPQERCPRCKAILHFASAEAVLQNAELDEKLIQKALIRIKNLRDADLGFEAQHALVMAYLNLKNLDEAARHLELAVRLRPDRAELPALLAELERCRALVGTTSATAAPSKAASVRRTILAVDDSPTLQKLVTMTLERRGYRVLVASNGMEALAMLNAAVPDLVLLDINLPQMDGFHLCRLIKARESTRDVAIVMLTGKDGFFDKVRGRMAGAVEYLTKPFNPEVLVQVVEKHCRPVKRIEF
jgi:twitching motility two-component system response regulator PilG